MDLVEVFMTFEDLRSREEKLRTLLRLRIDF